MQQTETQPAQEHRRIYAFYDDIGVRVYQAFEPRTVRAAVEKGTFGVGFGLDRITWIKPSFGWMLHRSSYASKSRQEAIARIMVTHAGFRAILEQSVPTHFDPAVYASEFEWRRSLEASDVCHQWDPDRAPTGEKLDRRAIQIGIRGAAIRRYVAEWIVGVEDVTELAHAVGKAARTRGGKMPPLPEEHEYPVTPDELARRLGITSGQPGGQ